MSEEKRCAQCGAVLAADAPQGLCPACLLKRGFASSTGAGESQNQGARTEFVPPPPAELAQHFPELEILGLVGRGGMGVVYKARQKRLDRLVALKILPGNVSRDPAFAERFQREAKALARLTHPNIVTVHDFGQTDGLFYFVMEFVDGMNLRQLLDTGKLSPKEALAIVPQICDALQYAHDKGIVHRDIKPENILIDKSGVVKIADFGLAKIVGLEAKDLTITSARDVIGTPLYMAPEQVEHPQDVDHRADIYSLGVVFYQMLTGELPIGRFAAPSRKVQIDVRLDEVVLRALEKEPEHRYQHASDVKTQVETIVMTPPGRGAPAPALSRSLIPIAGRFFVAGVSMLFACLIVLLAMSSEAIGQTWAWFRLGLEIFAGLASVGLLFIAYQAITTKTPEARRLAKSMVPWMIVMVLGILFGFWSPHLLSIKSDYIGQTWFPGGDSIEITSVVRTKERLMAKGHYNLVSHDSALLALFITTTNREATSIEPRQKLNISKGAGDFELVRPHPVPGLPHVSMYADGHPFASLYFGTKAEALEENRAGWITNTPSGSAEAATITFGPVIERVLDNAMALGSGRTGTSPLPVFGVAKGGKDRLLENIVTIEQAGWDVIQDSPDTILALGMKVLPLTTSQWDTLNPQQTVDEIERARVQVFVGFRPDANGSAGFPATYAFQTREGATGILQITGFTDNLHRARIRYKLVQTSSSAANPPFVARYGGGTVELVALTSKPWTNGICWRADGAISKDPFPAMNGGTDAWSANKEVERVAFRVLTKGGTDISTPVSRVNEDSGVLTQGPAWQPPCQRSPDGLFLQTITCPTNARAMNISLGIAEGSWETAVTLKHETNVAGSAIEEGEWSASYDAMLGRDGNAAVSCNYCRSANWETRMVYVNGNGKITAVPENSARASALQTGGVLLVSSNDFAHIKEFQLQRRKYQWVEFRNVSLQPGYMTTVEIQDSGGERESKTEAQNLSFGPVKEIALTNEAFISFDSGRLVEQAPAYVNRDGIGESVITALDWMEKEGLDALYESSEGLLAVGMKLAKLQSSDWSGMNPAELMRRIESSTTNTVPQVRMSVDTNEPSIYGFKTRAGGVGIVQITALTNDPSGVWIRYKMAQPLARK